MSSLPESASPARLPHTAEEWARGALDPAPPEGWHSAWIGPPTTADQGATGPAWRVFTTVTVPAEVRRAWAFVSAHGVVDLHINGQLSHAETLTPGFTSYRHRLGYAAYDVTRFFHQGENALGAEIADGWWRGRLGFDGGSVNLWGRDVAALIQIELDLADGTHLRVTSDDTWRCTASPRRRAGLYDGETYDAREDTAAWMTPGADIPGALPVSTTPLTETLFPLGQRRLQVMETLEPVEITRLDSATILVDFGQNAAGRVSLTADIPEGRQLRLRHAEVCQDGRICTRPLRLAHAEDVFLGDGHGPRAFEPRFTTHGFRYVELSDAIAGVDLNSVRFHVVRSPIPVTATLESSSELINQLVSNVGWSLRSNFAAIPTDCPQRDERLGWTGDIQAFGPTALTLGQCAPFLNDWLRDVRAEQEEHGAVPVYVPWVPAPNMWTPTTHLAVWEDVAALLPWELYQHTGDVAALREQWPLVSAWARQLIRLVGEDLWLGDLQLADWLDPTAPPEDPLAAQTDPDLVANAYAYRSLDVATRIAEILGEDAAPFAAAAAHVRAAWRSRYLREGTTLASPTQTAYSLAIGYGLLEQAELPAAGEQLAALVREHRHRIGTGFAGTPLVCDALTRTGHLEDAYGMLATTECPSWGYPISMGATTIWERWDSLLPDGTVNPGDMTSFNHYALGAVVDWIFRTVGGITATEPGYRSVRIAPQPGGELTHAACHVETPRGPIDVRWNLDGADFHVRTTIPAAVTAELRLPDGTTAALPAGEASYSCTLPR